MRFSFAFVGLVAIFATGLLAPVYAQALMQTALVPVVPADNTAADTNQTLSTVEASALFAGKIGARKIEPDEMMYVVLRPFPRSANRTRENETDAFSFTDATKTLALFGGLLDRAYLNRIARSTAINSDDSSRLTLYVDSKRTVGASRYERNAKGERVSVTPLTNSDYYVELTNLSAFDGRLYDTLTNRITIPLRANSAKNARKIARAYLIVAGVRYSANREATGLNGALSFPRDLQAEATAHFTYKMKTTLSDLFVVEAVTKKVVLHYAPKPQPMPR